MEVLLWGYLFFSLVLFCVRCWWAQFRGFGVGYYVCFLICYIGGILRVESLVWGIIFLCRQVYLFVWCVFRQSFGIVKFSFFCFFRWRLEGKVRLFLVDIQERGEWIQDLLQVGVYYYQVLFRQFKGLGRTAIISLVVQ